MQNHTLILSTAKSDIPKPVTIDFVIDLINSGLTAVEYFGIEIYNDEDYKEEAEAVVHHPLTIIEFFFETSTKIQYDNIMPSEINSLILDLIMLSPKKELRADEKNITVNL